MDLLEVSRTYLNRILGKDDKSTAGSGNVKVLLLDKYTTPIISMISTQSELLRHEIYLIDRVDNQAREKMKHLSCICFVKPDDETVNHLINELKAPKYKSYELYFNNILPKNMLERLLENDDLEIVSKVQEIFLDYLTINKDLYAANQIDDTLFQLSFQQWNRSNFSNVSDSLVSVLLSLKQKPVIRYEKNSNLAEQLAGDLLNKMKENNNNQLFDNVPKRDVSPLLLILDRKNDPITPLLIPWTFQSMVHELIGIHNNTVDLSHIENISQNLTQVVLSPDQDNFFKESMYLNFGDLSDKLKKYVDSYKQKTKTSSNLDSLQDMKKFVENYPEFRKLSTNVSKHMTLASELDKKITQQRLWEVSELEQSLSSSNNHASDLEDLIKILNNESTSENPTQERPLPISMEHKLKLVLLYGLRYESTPNNQLNNLIQILKQQGLKDQQVKILKVIFNKLGKSKRLDQEDTLFTKATSNLINGFKIAHDNENVFMQHIPRLETVISKLVRGKLPLEQYPLKSLDQSTQEKYQDIIIYMIGGTTYEEARIIHNLLLNNSSCRLVLGGDQILSTRSYLENLFRLSESEFTD